MYVKHLNTEEMMALLEGSLSLEVKSDYEKHIHKCDKCFLEFSQYSLSYDELEQIKFEVTPDDLIKRTEHEFFLIPKDNKISIWNRIRKFIPNENSIPIWSVTKRTAELLAFGIAAIIVFIIIGYNSENEQVSTSIDFKTFKQNYMMRPTEDITEGGLKISVMSDTLNISQPIQIIRKVMFYDSLKNPIAEQFVSGLSNTLSLPPSLKNEKIYIEITTFDTIVWRGLIEPISEP
ncbi:MAG: hypothetical protein HN936_01035 [Bacteroidetes bacterium]|jgi:hypothetical protein|nr:hypothetical protein [Bacteroidota bacterium]